ncbi:MAG: HEAT repeat domain-containing protein, partial [Candidatus Omnitrophota bacterium]|nr:HEAT repeat domain-containing protein [Candidatus Omnitrophota bacterium]
MYNYHFETIRNLDIALLGIIVLVSLVIIISSFIKDRFWDLRINRLLNIKRQIYALVSAGQDPAIAANLPFFANITPQQFLDIEANRVRDDVSFNDAERNFLKNCFIHSGHIASLKKTAERSGNKLRKIEAGLCLGYAGEESAADILKKSLYDKDEDLAYFAMIALGQIKTLLSAKALIELLRKNTPGSYKIVSLLEDFPAYIADDVMALAGDPDPAVKVWGMRLLPKFAAERHVKKIEV